MNKDRSVLSTSLQYIKNNHNIPYYLSLTPNSIKTFIKRVIRRVLKFLITPILTMQNNFNVHVVQCLNQIALFIDDVFVRIDNTQCELKELKQCVLNEEQKIHEIYKKLECIDRQSDFFSASVAKIILSNKLANNVPLDRPAVKSAKIVENEAEKDTYAGLDYFKFQNFFRGTRSLITARQSIYIPYFEKSIEPVLEIGCGRGEFLQLLKKAQVSAFGFDLYPEYVVEGELNGLDVRQGDGIAFLQETDQQFGGIFVAQVIEHISFEQLKTLCFAAYEKLAPGACLVMETPNPTCLAIYTNSFYIDPTHQRPVHPALLTYLLQEAGFQDIQILYTEVSRTGEHIPKIDGDGIHNLQEVNKAIDRISELLYGSQDYAAIARKESIK